MTRNLATTDKQISKVKPEGKTDHRFAKDKPTTQKSPSLRD